MASKETKMKQALEQITEINSKLLKNKLKPQDDLLVLQAQEIAQDALA
jgi:hypothetical protein